MIGHTRLVGKMRMDNNFVKAFKCQCGKLIEIGSNDYIRFHGNVYVGESGGIIGNNFPDEEYGKDDVESTRLCWHCTIKLLKQTIDSVYGSTRLGRELKTKLDE